MVMMKGLLQVLIIQEMELKVLMMVKGMVQMVVLV
jgi:hypothetical protein